MQQSQSEVARLIERIDQEYTAASLALSGLAEGAARHTFISTRMERMQQASQELIDTIGHEQAVPLIVKAMDGGKQAAQQLIEAIEHDEAVPPITTDGAPS